MSPEAKTKEQEIVRTTVTHVLERVLPEPALRHCIKVDNDTLTVEDKEYDLNTLKKVILVGGGKAGRRTAAELANILGDRITAGFINVYQDQAAEPVSDKIKLFAANHPTPNEEGVEGANLMLDSLKNADSSTLVIALISGGGSALMATPMEVVTLQDYKDICDLLLTVPATIDEINSVRKHIDPLKGGGMRKIAENAGGFISLVLSDVPVTKTGVVDDPSVIASGPTVGDESTFEMAKNVLVGHGIWDQTPESVKKYFEDNLGKEENETLRKDSPLLTPEKSQYVIMANNDQAMEAAGEKVAEYGYTVDLIGCNTGLTKDKIKDEVTEEIDNIWSVVTPHLQKGDKITFSSFSTDGVDGHCDLAGAVADMNTLKTAKEMGIDHKQYLANYDSASFFKKLGLDIETGPTGTNVADLCLVLITNPDAPDRKIAIIFGGEATVNIALPDGQKPGFGGRNTHLTLMAAEILDQLNN
jgi:glycerate 2-kinase